MKPRRVVHVALRVRARSPHGAPLRAICDTHDVVEQEVERELRGTLQALREPKEELSDFVENAAFPLHVVRGDETIAWAVVERRMRDRTPRMIAGVRSPAP